MDLLISSAESARTEHAHESRNPNNPHYSELNLHLVGGQKDRRTYQSLSPQNRKKSGNEDRGLGSIQALDINVSLATSLETWQGELNPG